MDIDAWEIAAALVPAGGAYLVEDNLSIDLLEMLAKYLVCHSYQIKSLHHAFLFVAYPGALPSKGFSRKQV
jgi:hypothetical protein